MRHIWYILFLIGVILMNSCSLGSDADGVDFVLNVPSENEYESGIVWTVKMDSEICGYVLEEGTLYALTENNTVYLIDIKSGEIKKSLAIPVNDHGCDGVDVDNGVLGVYYVDNVVVYDTNSERLVYNYTGSAIKNTYSFDSNVIVNDHILILSEYNDPKIVAVDYRNGSIIWEIPQDKEHGGIASLVKHGDRILYKKNLENFYCEIDPNTGAIINTFKGVVTGEASNASSSDVFVEYPSVDDPALQKELNFIGEYFRKLDNGDSYYIADEKLYMHGTDGKLKWTANLPGRVEYDIDIGKYILLDFKGKIALLDIDKRKFVWSLDAKSSSKELEFFYNGKLFIPEEDGSITMHDFGQLFGEDEVGIRK